MKVFINSIQFNRSLVDGPGVRTVVFFQGCDLRCEGCHNKSTWDPHGGTETDVHELATLLRREVRNKKVTISGGEPLLQTEALLALVKLLDGFDIAVYTGHEEAEVPSELLLYVSYIKTGPYKRALRTTTKPFVGSSNQTFRRVK